MLLQHSSRGAVFGYQISAIAVTLAIATVGGSLAGWVVSTVNLADQTLTPAQLFDDGTFWTVRRPVILNDRHENSVGVPRSHI